MTIQWTPSNKPTIEYTSIIDGKTYCAKQITGTENGKSITGMYVCDKSVKPDNSGNITGEFMSNSTFLERMAEELPTVNSELVTKYNPNIRTLSEEEKFDKNFDSGIKLSDGKILLRPELIFTGSKDIQKNKDGNFVVTTTSFVGGFKHPPQIEKFNEEDLINNKSLCGGTLKKLDDNSYEVTYYTDEDRNNHDMTTEIMDKKSCIEFLDEQGFYI